MMKNIINKTMKELLDLSKKALYPVNLCVKLFSPPLLKKIFSLSVVICFFGVHVCWGFRYLDNERDHNMGRADQQRWETPSVSNGGERREPEVREQRPQNFFEDSARARGATEEQIAAARAHSEGALWGLYELNMRLSREGRQTAAADYMETFARKLGATDEDIRQARGILDADLDPPTLQEQLKGLINLVSDLKESGASIEDEQEQLVLRSHLDWYQNHWTPNTSDDYMRGMSSRIKRYFSFLERITSIFVPSYGFGDSADIN